ncbi:CHAP domain-containing protein [Antrihabitans sp. YC2-6]|uniref:CHAP domain-containing protein n=1 Tax=Antrihabitans sp. YC2-6 TaxID=2799498 RepID=UPI0018F75E14|nr:CHAP domain-containing protein [Antrihabitans sp. YC2-6]MBJ8343675.1 CHAP domain-containing protein [Antrihabitans sp. YC2-6]
MVTFFGKNKQEFPAVDPASLGPGQQRIVEILRTEFDGQRPGTTYSEGVEEAWCADFVSWVMREAGVPFANPNSGSWRIPGVAALEEYYRGTDRFVAAGSDFRPVIGDVALYSAASPFGQHTNIVVAVDGAEITTVGGNEGNEIRVSTFTIGADPGLVGFGKTV